MKGFKDSTKVQYAQGGSCYAKGGSVKGAAKISKVMGEFKSGELHSGSKKGPVVTNPKQATAIALSEARKAGAKVPAKKYQDGGAVARGNRAAALEQREEAALVAEGRRKAAREAKRGNPYIIDEPKETIVRETITRPAPKPKGKPGYRDIPLIGGALDDARQLVKVFTGYKKGGLAAMPKGKK